MARPRSAFVTVRSEGALLPPDELTRIADRTASGMSPPDYHLQPHERINEAISQSWNRLVPAWTGLKDALGKLPMGAAGTSETRERWLLVIFDELGFGRLATARGELEGPGGRKFAISHVSTEGLPVHLVGFGQDLDRRTPGRVGAATSSPHGLVQELLNDSPGHRWGVVSNGRQLRLLRDNAALTRQAYVEFDLEDMFDGEVYSDFALLWLVCHESRFSGPVGDSWLDRWSQEAQKAGVRALDTLRDGVQAAIEALGAGFARHPANSSLRADLKSGAIGAGEYYRQILRLVYRLIFLLVAEDRNLLLQEDVAAGARETYAAYYSVDRLRRLASIWRGATAHPDLWRSLRLVTSGLGADEGLPALGLPSLGSFLWSPASVSAIEGCDLANRDLLTAIRHLTLVEVNRTKRQVDYRNLGAEELGGVYESLLELHPRINSDLGTFELKTAGGHERKTTGSYYTPTSLITSLLDSALDPVLDEAARKPEAEKAILELRVVDPACGSGHFLIAAAHRIARRLAGVRTGLVEPSPKDVLAALRDVIGHCIYGVDVNPMAVELCKVSLWIEALDPGRPLSFLDHRIRNGHSLLGGTRDLVAAGIPDAAFVALEGDDKKWVTSLRKRNRAERDGQLTLGRLPAKDAVLSIAVDLKNLDVMLDNSAAALHEKEKRWASVQAGDSVVAARLEADAWCAAFMVSKRSGEPEITDEVRLQLAAEPAKVDEADARAIRSLTARFRFFHWHLEFADVFASGGFDVVLGNPPWERVKLQELEFFAQRDPDLAKMPGARRKAAIVALRKGNPELDHEFRSALHDAEAISHFLRESGRYPLCGRGDVNTYTVFAEAMRDLVGPAGRSGIIVPSGIATDDTTKEFFQAIVDERRLVSLFDFENAAPIFEGVHRSYKFCLLTMSGLARPIESPDFVFFAHRVEDLNDPDRRFQLTAADFKLLNPNTRTCPIFRTQRDAQITKGIYSRVPVLIDRTRPDGNPWGVSFMRMFDMTNDSGLFKLRSELLAEGWTLDGNVFRRGEDAYLPLYEGKMFHHFDHRYATYIDPDHTRELTDEEKSEQDCLTLPSWWVHRSDVESRTGPRITDWHIVWRDIARNNDVRTVIATIVPRSAIGNNAPTAVGVSPLIVAVMSSLPVDFVARLKAGGTHLNFYIVEQLPVLAPGTFDARTPWDIDVTFAMWLTPRMRELLCTATDMSGLARYLGEDGLAFQWIPARRELIRAELDAAAFHLYGLRRDEVDYVMETFPIVKRNDEALHGEYRTRRLVLERYDAISEAISSGVTYRTVLDPPPGHSSLSFGVVHA